jgi:hypothetical protein
LSIAQNTDTMAIQIIIEPCLNWFKFKPFSLFKWRKVQTKPIGIY